MMTTLKDVASNKAESRAVKEEIERNLKQAREDIKSGNLFDAGVVFEELRRTKTDLNN